MRKVAEPIDILTVANKDNAKQLLTEDVRAKLDGALDTLKAAQERLLCTAQQSDFLPVLKEITAAKFNEGVQARLG